jgi:hypothetical protein
MILPWRKRSKAGSDNSHVSLTSLSRHFDNEGMVIEESEANNVLPAEAAGLLVQLEDEGLASIIGATYRIDWGQLYRLLDHNDYFDDLYLLDIPAVGEVFPRLISRGSLTDPDFVIAIDGWFGPQRQRLNSSPLRGAILNLDGSPTLLSENVWQLVKLVRQFGLRNADDRNDRYQRSAWGEIRAMAIKAGAMLDDFLFRTVVLAPSRLQFSLRRGHGGVVEVEPNFNGAPKNWLTAFDNSEHVLDRYDLPTADGIVQVITSDPIKNVLGQIKAMPGRRVAGTKAEAFLLNPIAALGVDASDIIDSDQFELEKENAGIVFDHFSTWYEMSGNGNLSAGLHITTATSAGISSSKVELSHEQAIEFSELVDARIARDLQLLVWRDYEFELNGDSALECQKLLNAFNRLADNLIQVRYEDIHDLASYSARVAEIGIEQPIYSPYIAKKSDDEGWFPENILPVISWIPSGEDTPIGVVATPDLQEKIRLALANAVAEGHSAIEIPGLPEPMPVNEAKALMQTFGEVISQPPTVSKPSASVPLERQPKIGLILKANIEHVDYAEARRSLLSSDGTEKPILPISLRQDVALKDHQKSGVAWMQKLFTYAPHECRGAVLADDMGLGKTLQLLCFIAAAREANPDLPPALVVAPLSLLENWKEEVERFFLPGSFRLLTAYGSNLTDLRVPQSIIDEQLRKEGLVRFLKPDWRDGADIVLTTYETLRDMEFSFAREKWSVMVCDEAQKIKNPAAKVTKAAKKQQTMFRIACTGTPVENSLVDLWCLFDFVQPGLLGALNDFGRDYRRPIETDSHDEREKVEELRELVSPQILRRMKADVAKDLKAKIVDRNCLSLPLSDHQRLLYSNAVELYHRRNDPDALSPFANQLGLLHYLRLVCTDPQRPGLETFVPEALASYRKKAPKLDWLMRAIEHIQELDEKAIVFCEFKNIQRMLRHYIQVAFGIAPDIINGDTSASAESLNSRQKRIKAFQQKPGFGIIILSPVAVGFGVNIQAANHVIHYTRTWNPAKEDQATDRAYRIGQTRDVHVYYPIIRAEDFKTFDVKLDELLSRKRSLAGDMLNGAGDIGARDFDLGELTPMGSGTFGNELVTMDDVFRMNPIVFECFAAALWSAQGWRMVTRTQRKSDGGVDVVARNEKRGVLIQCKSTGSDRLLNWSAIQEIVTGHAIYKRLHPNIDFELICITNGQFNNYAKEQAMVIGVQLIEKDDIETIIMKNKIRLSDIDKFSFDA